MLICLNFKENLVNFCNYFNFLSKNSKNMVLFPQIKQLLECSKYSKKEQLGLQNFGVDNLEKVEQILRKVRYCLVGHSDRRKEGDTNDIIVQKIDVCLKNNVTPILCVGEVDKMSKKATLQFINSQLDVVRQLGELNASKIIVAYEPVFAIGTGVACNIEHIQLVVNFIRQRYPFKMVMYGGSVNEQNCLNLFKETAIDGFLIGKTSLNVEKVNKIIEIVSK